MSDPILDAFDAHIHKAHVGAERMRLMFRFSDYIRTREDFDERTALHDAWMHVFEKEETK